MTGPTNITIGYGDNAPRPQWTVPFDPAGSPFHLDITWPNGVLNLSSPGDLLVESILLPGSALNGGKITWLLTTGESLGIPIGTIAHYNLRRYVLGGEVRSYAAGLITVVDGPIDGTVVSVTGTGPQGVPGAPGSTGATGATVLATSGVFATTGAGIAGTTSGQYFCVQPSAYTGGLLDLYKNVSGTATFIGTTPLSLAVDSATASSKTQAAKIKDVLQLKRVAYASKLDKIIAASPSVSDMADNLYYGFAQKFVPAAVTFNAIRIPRLQRRSDCPIGRQWGKLWVIIRANTTGSQLATAPIIALGWVELDPAVLIYDNLIVPFRDPADAEFGVFKTLTNADLSTEYTVGMWTTTSSGGKAAMYRPNGTMSNSVGLSYYAYDTVGGTPLTSDWQPYTSNPAFGFDHLLLAGPYDQWELNPAFAARIIAGDALGLKASTASFTTVATWDTYRLQTPATNPAVVYTDPVITGYGDAFTAMGDVFNGVTYPGLVTDPGAVSLNLIVRRGATGASQNSASELIAVGTTPLDPTRTRHGDVTLAARDPTTGAFIAGFDNTYFTGGTSEYFLAVQAVDINGVPVRIFGVVGATSGRVGRSYYVTSGIGATSNWSPIGSAFAIAVQRVYLTGQRDVYTMKKVARADVIDSVNPNTSPALLRGVPPVIYGSFGREVNLYFDNLIMGDARDYRWNVECALGKQQDERWTWVPDNTTHVVPLRLYVYDKVSGALLDSALITFRSSFATSTSYAIRMLAIGDSMTANGVPTGELRNLAAADGHVAVTSMGTKGSAPNVFEAKGGWTVQLWYRPSGLDSGGIGYYTYNPFASADNAIFSLTYAMSNAFSGQAAPTFMPIRLGTNDVYNIFSDADCAAAIFGILTQYEAMVQAIFAFSSLIKIGICLPSPPPASEDGFGFLYGCYQTRWQFKRNILQFTEALVAHFGGREGSGIYVIPTNAGIDTVHNYPVGTTENVNSRSTVQIIRNNNDVHPATNGYQQDGEVLWAFTNWLAQNT